jgi:hypothetical protein
MVRLCGILVAKQQVIMKSGKEPEPVVYRYTMRGVEEDERTGFGTAPRMGVGCHEFP